MSLHRVGPATEAADAGHRGEPERAIDALGVIVLVGHYDEPVDPCQPVPGNLAQQLTAQPLIAPCLPCAHQLEARPRVSVKKRPQLATSCSCCQIPHH